MSRRAIAALTLFLTFVYLPVNAFQSPADTSRLIGEVFANGQQMKYVTMLSDQIGHRLTGSTNAKRAEEMMEAEMKRLGLTNVRREPFQMPIFWERGTAEARLTSHGNRQLNIASYTWTPGTNGPVEGPIVHVGAGKPEDVGRAKNQLRGAIALAVPAGATLDEVIYNFYRAPRLAQDLVT